MLGNKKIIVVTPAGRKKYMEILIKYILAERDIIDEYRIWVNTKDENDISYFKSLEEIHKGFVTLDIRHIDEEHCGTNLNIHKFFDRCTESNVVYIRLDDDVVWLSKNFIKNLAEFRIENTRPFLIYPAIINNSICDYIFQNLGYYKNFDNFDYDCTSSIAFTNNYIAESKHKEMLKNIQNLDTIRFPESWELRRYERVSINCISWLGEAFANFNGIVGHDEELWLSVDKPKELKRPNIITGNSMCSHFAFGPQREHLDNTDILEAYQKLSNYISVDPKSLDFSKIDWKTLPDNFKLRLHMLLVENDIKY
jgi:hypothetical protein